MQRGYNYIEWLLEGLTFRNLHSFRLSGFKIQGNFPLGFINFQDLSTVHW